MLRLVDLSLDIYDRAPTFWPDPKTAVIPHLTIQNLSYNITQLIMSTHLCTHLDAPYHFFDDGRTVENLDIRRGFGPAWVLDFSYKAPKEEITIADLQIYAGKIMPGRRLIFRTGWDKQFPQPHYFSDQPYLGAETCRWLVEKGVITVALDMPTIYPADYITVHHLLLRPEILVIEGLARLDQLQSEEVILCALPLRIRGRDGSPCRAVAIDADAPAELAPLVALLDGLQFAPPD
ncbi:MAG: cyclase family protein [Anaerolineae bacterium]|nr:cyclase family protein [Anaerolineae bacterium]